MKRCYPDYILLDIADFIQTVRPVAMTTVQEQWQKLQTNPLTYPELRKEADKQMHFLISRLMEDLFLVYVASYDRKRNNPVFLRDALSKRALSAESLFSQLVKPCRSFYLTDIVGVQITTRDLIISCYENV